MIDLERLKGFIMSGDTPVARFEGRRVTPIVVERVPLCFTRGGDFEDWLEHRAIDRHRTNSRILKRILRLTDTSDIGAVLRFHGATVTDNYWVKFDGEDISSEQIMFTSDYFANVALRCDVNDFAQEFTSQQLNTPTPELTNIGSFEKCWKLSSGVWTMLKSSTLEERFSEIFISLLCDAMKLRTAKYYEWNGYTASPDFTDGRFNFEPMRYIVYDDDDYDLSYRSLQAFNKSLEQQYLDLLFMDALVLNPDRHTENYGILRDRVTGAVVDMAPNFDNNLALISRGYASGGSVPVNPLIGFFHELLESQSVTYVYPELPHDADLHFLISVSATGKDIRQEYVYRMIQQNYENLIKGVTSARKECLNNLDL